MSHVCFACKRPAAMFDRQIGEWVCEGNADCGMSRNAPRDTEAPYLFPDKPPAKSSTRAWNIDGRGGNPKGTTHG
jgi:hypothetical protein